MNQRFIPLNNSIDKAIAFAPSLGKDFHKDYKVIRPKNYVDSIGAVEKLQNQGWFLEGITEEYNQEMKPTGHQIKMFNPDITMKNSESVANTYITNTVVENPRNPNMEISLGVYRQVCANGMFAMRDTFRDAITSDLSLQFALDKIESESRHLIQLFENTKQIELAEDKQYEYAKEIMKYRFGKDNNIKCGQLLNCHRPEDEGNSVWKTFNRIQENITKPFMIKNTNGHNINGVTDYYQNQRINQELYKMMIQPHINN